MPKYWYAQYMPTVKEAAHIIKDFKKKTKNIDQIKKIYACGSFLQNESKPNQRIKDIDMLAKVNLHSEDLQAVDQNAITTKTENLEDEGFDKKSVEFTKQILAISNPHIDHWIISSDKRLLHWGPVCGCKKESDQLKSDAEKFASKETGISYKKLQSTSNEKRNNWYSEYKLYINRELEGMPFGWYISSEKNISSILKKAKEIN